MKLHTISLNTVGAAMELRIRNLLNEHDTRRTLKSHQKKCIRLLTDLELVPPGTYHYVGLVVDNTGERQVVVYTDPFTGETTST